VISAVPFYPAFLPVPERSPSPCYLYRVCTNDPASITLRVLFNAFKCGGQVLRWKRSNNDLFTSSSCQVCEFLSRFEQGAWNNLVYRLALHGALSEYSTGRVSSMIPNVFNSFNTSMNKVRMQPRV
jgi:hypothetical protein